MTTPDLAASPTSVRRWVMLTDHAKRRWRSGDLGALPVVVGLIAIWTVFTILNDRFLSAENLSNLALQMAPVGTMSLGIVLVLLLGEIDLSAGSVSGLCGAVLAVVHVRHGLHPLVGVAAALGCAALIGLSRERSSNDSGSRRSLSPWPG